MLTREQVKVVMAIFSSVYRRSFETMSPQEVNMLAGIWESEFKGYTFDEVKEVVMHFIRTSKFMPSLAEILEELAKRRAPELATSPLDAWAHVREVVRQSGYYKWQEASEALSERERAIVKSLGWSRICLAENGYEMEALKKEFMELYEGSRQKALAENLCKNRLEYQNIKSIENKGVQKGVNMAE